MDKKKLFEQLYKERMPITLDLKVLLFYYCKMGCEFCIQKIWDKTGMDAESVSKKADMAIETVNQSNKEYVNMTIFGGEMFADFVPDELFPAYFDLLNRINQACVSQGKKLTVTNFNSLWYRKRDRVKKLLDDCEEANINIRFGISYDPEGRFHNKSMHKIFVDNEKYFEKYIIKYNTILTKQVIDLMLRPEGLNDPYFDYLYHKYEYGTRHYWKNEYIQDENIDHTHWQHADEEDLYKAYLYLYENYPKGDFVQNFLETIYSNGKIYVNDCPGERKVFLPDNSTVYCINNPDCGSGCGPMKYMEWRGCLSCEYFNSCRVDCFYEEQDPNVKKMDDCMYKAIYKEYEKREAALGKGNSKLEGKAEGILFNT